MKTLDNVISICKSFINGDYTIEEFQYKLETVVLPDEYKHTLEKGQHNMVNYLEEIRFNLLKDNQQKEAIKAAEKFIHEVREYINKQ